jgi:inhibitor of KinA
MAIAFRTLGDRGLIVTLQEEADAHRLAVAVRAAGFDWLEDVVPAYATVGIFFDPDRIDGVDVQIAVSSLPLDAARPAAGKLHEIPCCYTVGPDTAAVIDHLQLGSLERLIALHSSREYSVYAVGFTPGFPYLGYLPPELTGVPRKNTPRMRVEPGSVGLAGRQTGIYPMARPGGWNLIGRTPMTLVDLERDFFPIAVGDRVRFVPIAESEMPPPVNHAETGA